MLIQHVLILIKRILPFSRVTLPAISMSAGNLAMNGLLALNLKMLSIVNMNWQVATKPLGVGSLLRCNTSQSNPNDWLISSNAFFASPRKQKHGLLAMGKCLFNLRTAG